jgi:hypothetical protein
MARAWTNGGPIRRAKVWLDGKEMKWLTLADEELGVVRQHVGFSKRTGRLHFRRIRGVVRIEPLP